MSAKTIVVDEYPEAISVKDDNNWSVMVDNKCIGIGKTENVAWNIAKSHVLKKVMRRVFENL